MIIESIDINLQDRITTQHRFKKNVFSINRSQIAIPALNPKFRPRISSPTLQGIVPFTSEQRLANIFKENENLERSFHVRL